MASQHTDKLVKSFISGSSNPLLPGYDAFADLQDPTYMSFKLDFFPDNGLSMPDDVYSSGGLFRTRSQVAAYSSNGFFDSAAVYLENIGSPIRQHYLEIFTNLLYKIQQDAPWYFQSVSGLGDLYKIDPANNFRGKDKVLTIECLESIDLRMTLLSDAYRNMAFEVKGMRYVLPTNMRTFNMHVHVLEFRKFNTTFGKIADALDTSRTEKGQDRQITTINARKNVLNNGATSLFTGTFDNVKNVASNINNQLGGLFSNLGEQAGPDYNNDLKSAFEAISVQTFILKDCQFDFFSEAPGYLDTVSVKEMPEATHKFKIIVGKIEKTTSYSFDKYVISEYAKNSRITTSSIKYDNILGRSLLPSEPYFEETPTQGITDEKLFETTRESIFPSDGTTVSKYHDANKESDFLRKTPLERMLGGIIGNASYAINNEVNKSLGKLTNGIIGQPPMGNVFGGTIDVAFSASYLNSFIDSPNLFKVDDNTPTRKETLKNIHFETLTLEKTLLNNNVLIPPPISPEFQDENVYSGLIIQRTGKLEPENILTKSTKPDHVTSTNVFNGEASYRVNKVNTSKTNDEIQQRNIFK